LDSSAIDFATGSGAQALPRVGIGTARARLLRRALMLYALVLAIGALPFVTGMGAGLRAFGMGLWFPGAGFLGLGAWGIAFFLLTVLLILVGLFAWFAMGAIGIPVATWLLAAVVAGLAASGTDLAPWSPFAALFLVVASGAAWGTVRARRATLFRERRVERLAYLPKEIAAFAERRKVAPEPEIREVGERDLAQMRFILDRGLQPVESFDGFTRIDQFQPAAWRYQLNFLLTSLALQQCHYTPNFHGYLSEAQRRFIRKFQDKRVWGYWIWEKALGHFSTDFDPIGWDNIMLGGFMNMNISQYQAITGDRCFDEPGALRFQLNTSKTFVHDAHTINDAALRNYDRSPFTLYPCEPALAFAYCNLLGLSGVAGYDLVHGTRNAVPVRNRFRKNFEEDFAHSDFQIVTGICNLTGTEVLLTDGVYTDISYAWLANAHFPDIAERMWAITRKESISLVGGELHFKTRGPADEMDLGGYRKKRSTLYALTAMTAHEMGEYDIAQAAIDAIERECGPRLDAGVLSYDLSTYTQAHIAMGRIMRANDWRTLVNDGPPPDVHRGPLLEGAAYPDVLVASARIRDGETLDLVLYPGGPAGFQSLGFTPSVSSRTLAKASIATGGNSPPETGI
jgi:hypothetical protein